MTETGAERAPLPPPEAGNPLGKSLMALSVPGRSRRPHAGVRRPRPTPAPR